LMIRPVLGNIFDGPTSIEAPPAANDKEIRLFPNPAALYVRIEFENSETENITDYHVEIYDAGGRLQYSAPFASDYIDVSAFEQGLYFVRFIDRKSGNIQTQKLLISR